MPILSQSEAQACYNAIKAAPMDAAVFIRFPVAYDRYVNVETFTDRTGVNVWNSDRKGRPAGGVPEVWSTLEAFCEGCRVKV